MIGKTVAIALTALLALFGMAAVVAALIGALNPLNNTGNNPAGGPSPDAIADIPADYLALYTSAAQVCPGLHWSVLAAIGSVESNHGRSNLPGVHSGQNTAGARGPMQFLQPTFDAITAKHPLPTDGGAAPSPYRPRDAIYAAAYLLCDNGGRDGRNLYGAIYSYNHDPAYVTQVLRKAHHYATNPTAPLPEQAPMPGTDAVPAALGYARAQLGRPYQWGGDGPAAGDPGFDCSGLVRAAYATAGIQLPRTADTQWHTGPPVPDDQPLQPGDLVFYGTTTHADHVALYTGNGRILHTPDVHQPVQEAPLPQARYLGATRPAATGAPSARPDSGSGAAPSVQAIPSNHLALTWPRSIVTGYE